MLSLLGSAARAGPGDPLSLAEALRIAESRSGQITAAEAAIRAAQARAVAGAQLPDPVLRAGVDNLPVDGPERFSLGRDFMTMRRIGVMQELTAADKRRLRRERGDRLVAREQAQRDVALTTLRREAASAWFERVFAVRASELSGALLAELRLQAHTLEAGVRSGRTSAAESRAARILVAQAEDDRAMAAQRERVATRQLARWLGEEADRPPGPLPDTAQAGREASADTQDPHAELAMAREEERLAAADVQLARRARTLDWSVEFAYQQRGRGFADMVSFGVSVPLPLFPADRQDREVRASEAALAQARALREDLDRQHRAELGVLLAEWEQLGQRIAALERSWIPLLKERTELALAAYRGGTAGLGPVLEARRAEAEAALRMLGLHRERAQVWVRLRFRTVSDSAPGGSP